MAFLVAAIHICIDGFSGLYVGASFDTLIATIILVAYVLNRTGRHLAGKILLIAFLNLALALYCCLIPKYHGIYLFFFPLIGLSYVVFDHKHRMHGLFFVGLSAVLLVTLVVSDFKLFGDVGIPSSDEKRSFLVNLASSSLTLLLCINFMMKYNDESERHLLNMAAEIGQKNIHLQKTNAELDRFVYSASHDLRAPLLSIQGIVNIAHHENTDSGVGNYLNMINSQVVKLDSFIRDIINYSQNARTEVVGQPVNIKSVLNCVRENLMFMTGADKVRWIQEIDDQLEWTTDRSRVATILSNLLSNSIKFHNYSRDDKWIKIAAVKNCTTCSITVADNGVGISQEHHQRIFDMFYRAHDSSGSGLGLYIAKEIVEKMGGKIGLQSQPGHGSVFTVTLPA